jgi:hypothetical protein
MFVCQWHLDVPYGKQGEAVAVMRTRGNVGLPIPSPLRGAGALRRRWIAALGGVPGSGGQRRLCSTGAVIRTCA